MSDRPTPETDAKASPHIGFYSCATVPAEFARKLERERDEAIRQREETNTSSKYSCDYNYEQKLKAERERDEALELVSELKRKISDYCDEQLRLVFENRRLHQERDEALEHLRDIKEYGTEEINAAVELRQKLAAALVERDQAREDATNYYARIGELESERDELKEIVEQRILVGAEIHNKANSLIKQNDKTEAECERLRKQLNAATSALRQIHLEVGDWIRSTVIVKE